jgi:hypothetical protein
VGDHLVKVIIWCEERCALVTLVIERFGEYL